MNEDYEAFDAFAAIADAARSMLDGKLSFIEGERVICGLRDRARFPDRDPDLNAFIAIDSETDALPIGRVRDLWAPDALKRLQPEIDQTEVWAKEVGAGHCQNLLDRLPRPSHPRWVVSHRSIRRPYLRSSIGGHSTLIRVSLGSYRRIRLRF